MMRMITVLKTKIFSTAACLKVVFLFKIQLFNREELERPVAWEEYECSSVSWNPR
jgi:hypothetical protein